jgi:NADPH-dependent curcumin reductase CurA
VLGKLARKGIDRNFENVGGKIFHAVFERLNNFARVASRRHLELPADEPMAGPPKMFAIVQRLTLQGFIVSDHVALMNEFVNEVGPLLMSGKLKSRETVVDGLAQAPQAFIGLLKGENFGKLVVKVG